MILETNSMITNNLKQLATTNNYTQQGSKVLTSISGGKGSSSPVMLGSKQPSKSESVARKIASGI